MNTTNPPCSCPNGIVHHRHRVDSFLRQQVQLFRELMSQLVGLDILTIIVQKIQWQPSVQDFGFCDRFAKRMMSLIPHPGPDLHLVYNGHRDHDGPGLAFSPGIVNITSSLPGSMHLMKIVLFNVTLDCSSFQILAHLPNLRHITIQSCNMMELENYLWGPFDFVNIRQVSLASFYMGRDSPDPIMAITRSFLNCIAARLTCLDIDHTCRSPQQQQLLTGIIYPELRYLRTKLRHAERRQIECFPRLHTIQIDGQTRSSIQHHDAASVGNIANSGGSSLRMIRLQNAGVTTIHRIRRYMPDHVQLIVATVTVSDLSLLSREVLAVVQHLYISETFILPDFILPVRAPDWFTLRQAIICPHLDHITIHYIATDPPALVLEVVNRIKLTAALHITVEWENVGAIY